ncbi:MAG: ubiquitin-like domain-containing protein [Chloroflexota bacterium]
MLIAASLVLVGLSAAFFATRYPVRVYVDGQELTVYTNARTVLSALRDARIVLDPADRTVPGRFAAVPNGLVVRVERATSVNVAADGGEVHLRTQSATIAEALAEAGVALAPQDLVLAQGVPVDPASSIIDVSTGTLVASADPVAARPKMSAREGRPSESVVPRQPARLAIKRAVPVVVHDAGLTTTIDTPADTVGDALRGAGINVYLADVVRPPVGSPVQADMHVYIERAKVITIVIDDPEVAPTGSFVTRTRSATLREVLADEGIVVTGREVIRPSLDTATRHGLQLTIRRFHPVTIEVDGRVVNTKTKQGTVRAVLADEQISLGPMDKVSPPADAEPGDNTVIAITRVREADVEEEEAIPFESGLVRASAAVELDQTKYQPGESGVLKRKVRVTYENGVPVNRTVLEEVVSKEPVPEVTYYGTKVVVRELETPDGTVKYWRKITVLATYYHNSTSGKPADHPQYGITRTGTRTAYGTVATDPRVIPLWSKMYVPGYGVGTALDTGGGVLGKHIDVYLPEDESWWGVRYPTIYLLTPVPDWYPERLP